MQPLPSSANLISEFSMGRVNAPVKVAHFFFFGCAGDTIVFCDSDCEQIVNLHCGLTWFEAMSSLRVNFAKSSLIPTGKVETFSC